LIETFGLGKRFGDKVALEDLTLQVQPGEVLGFLGPNGSGKTTTIRLLMGLYKPSAGRATILGRDCHADAVALKREVGYLPDEPFLYPYLSGRELLELVAGLHGFAGAEARGRAGAALERFGLAAEGSAFTATYSLGMRKRLALAAALIHQPRVLILDEPQSGLDPRGARDMRDTVAALAAEGRTVFLATHLLDVAEKLCHRVAIIGAGRLRALGTPAELRARLAASPDTSLEELFLRVTEP
jgi:ABC-2 type transport system ATP-binding protein